MLLKSLKSFNLYSSTISINTYISKLTKCYNFNHNDCNQSQRTLCSPHMHKLMKRSPDLSTGLPLGLWVTRISLVEVYNKSLDTVLYILFDIY